MEPHYEYDAFMSHAGADYDIVIPLIRRMQARGLKVWTFEDHLGHGTWIQDVIDAAIDASRITVYCLSPAAIASPFVRQEISRFSIAAQPGPKKGQKLLCARIVDIGKQSPPGMVRAVEQILFPQNRDAEFEKLVAFCRPPGNWRPMIPIEGPADEQARRKALARVAYIFLRLDQLPSGGWGKSLASHMEALWAGDEGSIPRDPALRTSGGTDTTSLAVYQLATWLARHYPDDLPPLFNKGVFARAVRLMTSMWSDRTGIGSGMGAAGGKPGSPQLRHTAVAAAALMKVRLACPVFAVGDSLLRNCLTYLMGHVHRWTDDDSYSLGLWSALAKVRELLDQKAAAPTGFADVTQLRIEIDYVLPLIAQRVEAQGDFKAQPENTRGGEATFPTPYQRFWRFQRHGLVMYLPLLITEDGKLNSAMTPTLGEQFAECLKILIQSIDPHVADDRLALVNYHRAPESDDDPLPGYSPDFGLSVSTLALFGHPCMRALLGRSSLSNIDKRLDRLGRAVLALQGSYKRRQKTIFTFTGGPSFARVLDLLPAIDLAELRALNDAIENVLMYEVGVSEKALDALLSKAMDSVPNATNMLQGLRELLVDKLESGFHTPAPDPKDSRLVCEAKLWKEVREKAIAETMAAYDGKSGQVYAQHYAKDENVLYVLVDVLTSREVRGKGANADGPVRALDVGCGPGQYAVLLRDRGYQVDLLDDSKQMLKIAAKAMGLSDPPARFDWRELIRNTPSGMAGAYDLVFACAVLVHVPREDAEGLLQGFHRLLKPNGLLFVNAKIGDHSLISYDGRFFEFYPDGESLRRKIANAGFEILLELGRTNHRNLENRDRRVRWLNFYCRKKAE